MAAINWVYQAKPPFLSEMMRSCKWFLYVSKMPTHTYNTHITEGQRSISYQSTEQGWGLWCLTPLATIFLQNTLKSWLRGWQTLHIMYQYPLKFILKKNKKQKPNDMWYTYMGILNELVTTGNWRRPTVEDLEKWLQQHSYIWK